MLAQNFKTAADLRISDAEWNALRGVLAMLERGELQHAVIDYNKVYERKPRNPNKMFNMGLAFAHTRCGTAACIAGSCDLFFDTNFTRFHEGFGGNIISKGRTAALMDLFCPVEIDANDWDNISVEQAATALRSYLTTGEANWAEALAS